MYNLGVTNILPILADIGRVLISYQRVNVKSSNGIF
jgi:hypothetical protein